MSRRVPLAGLALWALAGCQPLEQRDAGFAQVPTSPFPPPSAQTIKLARFDFTPASEAANMRVDEAERRLVAANRRSGFQPVCKVIGAAEPEIFHIDQVVYLTEGLVQQCHGEAELAAVLANELGKIVSEREAAVSAAARAAVPPPPVPMPVGNPGSGFAADPGYYFEMAKYERDYPRSARNKPVPPPDPRGGARHAEQRRFGGNRSRCRRRHPAKRRPASDAGEPVQGRDRARWHRLASALIAVQRASRVSGGRIPAYLFLPPLTREAR